MSKPRDPRRLESDAPPDVREMIEALRSDGPSRDGMQRMAQRLDRVFDALPASGPVSGLSGRLLGKLGLALVASGALLVTATQLLRNSTEHDNDSPAAATAPRCPRRRHAALGPRSIPLGSHRRQPHRRPPCQRRPTRPHRQFNPLHP